MDLSFTQDQDALRGLARQIFTGHLTREQLHEVEAGEEWFDRELWASLAKANLLGIAIAEEYGGSGFGLIELCLLLEETGRAVAPLPLFPTLVLGALSISRYGTEDQKRRYLPGVVDGSVVLTAAMSGDASTTSVKALAMNGEWRLDGIASDVPAAHIASRMLVPARTADGVRLFLVDLASTVLTRNETTNGEPHFSVELHGREGEPLGNETTFDFMLEHALVGLCAMQVGVAERALRLTADYTSSREQFGRPLGSFQAVQQRAADCYIDVEAMRWTMWQAAWRLSERLPATEEVAIAKFWAADGGFRVVAAAQHLHGGIGVDLEYPLHRYSQWARQIELTLGGATAHLARLGGLMAQCP